MFFSEDKVKKGFLYRQMWTNNVIDAKRLLKILSKEEVLRSCFVKFYQKKHELGKLYCLKHFVAVEFSKRNIINLCNQKFMQYLNPNQQKENQLNKQAIKINKN